MRRARPIALPDVRRFDQLFVSWRPWVSNLRERPRGIPIPAVDHDKRGRALRRFMEIGPYLTVSPGHHSFHVVPSERTVDAIRVNTISIAYDTISFEVIVWDPTEALVVAKHGQIIGSVWLAVVDPLTVPGWLPSPRSRDALVQARRERSGDAYLVASDIIEEDGGEELEPSAKVVREYAKEAYRLARRRAAPRASRARGAR